MPLNQRERLHDRVVDASRDFGALLRPDPLEPHRISLPREPPEPRPHDRDERDRHGARSKRPTAVPERAALVDVDGRPGDDEHEAQQESGRLPPVAAPARHQEHPARDERRGDEQRTGEAEAAEEEKRREPEQRDPGRPRGAAAAAVGRARRGEEEPRAEVEHDPAPAREGQDREHEPHCRRVDTERVRDPAANARDGRALVPPPDLRERRKAGRRPALRGGAASAHFRGHRTSSAARSARRPGRARRRRAAGRLARSPDRRPARARRVPPRRARGRRRRPIPPRSRRRRARLRAG